MTTKTNIENATGEKQHGSKQQQKQGQQQRGRLPRRRRNDDSNDEVDAGATTTTTTTAMRWKKNRPPARTRYTDTLTKYTIRHTLDLDTVSVG